MLFHPNYKFEMYNYRKSFESFKKKDLILLWTFISEMLKQMSEKSGEIMIFCLSSNTLRDAEEKDLKEKFKLGSQSGCILTFGSHCQFQSWISSIIFL